MFYVNTIITAIIVGGRFLLPMISYLIIFAFFVFEVALVSSPAEAITKKLLVEVPEEIRDCMEACVESRCNDVVLNDELNSVSKPILRAWQNIYWCHHVQVDCTCDPSYVNKFGERVPKFQRCFMYQEKHFPEAPRDWRILGVIDQRFTVIFDRCEAECEKHCRNIITKT